ncbi:type II secretion system F family protein [Mariniblastus sp.]|nr:type II secretion system F family protein [bacterium]MDA7902294.1 type II secretion system F family protein [Mariniblastus sp.]MDA7928337.1 type II secretion system F family protein [Mariniblastus sp.]
MIIPILVFAAAIGTVVWLWQLYVIRLKINQRLAESNSPEQDSSVSREDLLEKGRVSIWLFRAGFRRPEALAIYYAATFVLGFLGLGLMFQLSRQGIFIVASEMVSSIPGGVGNVLIPFVLGTPWFLFAVLMLIPTLIVRSARRNRVKKIEQELPLLLDLLTTLAQAGIGFDSALDKILSVQKQSQPLVQELRLFQYDNLAGRSRVESLRRLMRRVHVPMFSAFISAIVQAEQTGTGMGATLKTQSAEMRSRRREKASAAALSVPTMLVLPMVLGFLPGIFIILLGPMLFEVFGVLDQSFRGPLGQ